MGEQSISETIARHRRRSAASVVTITKTATINGSTRFAHQCGWPIGNPPGMAIHTPIAARRCICITASQKNLARGQGVSVD